MTLELYQLKTLLHEAAKLGAAEYAKSQRPKSDEISRNQAIKEFGAWFTENVDRGLIKGKRKGVHRNSPIMFSRAEIMAVRSAELAGIQVIFKKPIKNTIQ